MYLNRLQFDWHNMSIISWLGSHRQKLEFALGYGEWTLVITTFKFNLLHICLHIHENSLKKSTPKKVLNGIRVKNITKRCCTYEGPHKHRPMNDTLKLIKGPLEVKLNLFRVHRICHIDLEYEILIAQDIILFLSPTALSEGSRQLRQNDRYHWSFSQFHFSMSLGVFQDNHRDQFGLVCRHDQSTVSNLADHATQI